MANFTFPTRQDLENIISSLYSEEDDNIKKYLPVIDDTTMPLKNLTRRAKLLLWKKL